MPYLKAALQKKRQELEVLIEMLEKKLRKSTKGNIKVITEKNGKLRYQVRFKPGDKYTYVSCKEDQLISRMVQRDYDKKLLRLAREELHNLDNYDGKYDDKRLSNIYKNANPARKLHLRDAVLPDYEYAEKWEKEKYIRYTKDLKGKYFTQRGEEVRSKIEVIIAEKLIETNCYYRVEPQVNLAPGITYYPDFMILNPRTKEIYLLEHFGMMSNTAYMQNTMKKIVNYELYATEYKDHLLMTFEDDEHPFDGSIIPDLAKKYFL